MIKKLKQLWNRVCAGYMEDVLILNTPAKSKTKTFKKIKRLRKK